MSFSGLSLDESPSWGVVSPPAGDLVKDALKKEQLLKYALAFPHAPSGLHTSSLRDIAAHQEDLRSSLFSRLFYPLL